MNFTDDDLKRLEDELRTLPEDPYKLKALLARLEAAELVVTDMETEGDYSPKSRLANGIKAWRKAAGK